MEIKRITENELARLAPLLALFRTALDSYRGEAGGPDEAAALEELQWLFNKGYPIFAAEDDGRFVGYIVCRIEDELVWVEQLYVLPEFRRRGAASKLFDEAEAIARSYGEETVFNYIHPNNDGVIAFLASRGYTVLNLIEVRKPWPGETTRMKISVGGHEFDY